MKMINNQVILLFCEVFSKKYNIPKEEVENVWKELYDIKKDKSTKEKKDNTKEKDNKDNLSLGCPYKWVKGKKAGQICGTKSKNGLYCSTHKKYENFEQKQRKIVPVCARTELAKKENKEITNNENKLTFRKNKELNLYINTSNNFALSSVRDKIVVGKIVDNKLVDLNEKDKEECQRLCLKYN